jgi:putative GTP pyrophosphokinase
VSGSDVNKAKVNRAGRVLRKWASANWGWDPPAEEEKGWSAFLEEVQRAFDLVLRYRAAHQYALTKATMGLRSVVKTEGFEVEVSQRLKRWATIIDKLLREPTMQLSTMQDIGGCRSVLTSIDEVRRVERRLKKNRPPLRVRDYITDPRSTGYRAVHVVVQYPDRDGTDRAIEVQLRTRVMHEWAIAVERFGGRLGEDLKGGRGPEEVLVWLRAVSEAMAIEEVGGTVPDDQMAVISRLRGAAVPYLGKRER